MNDQRDTHTETFREWATEQWLRPLAHIFTLNRREQAAVAMVAALILLGLLIRAGALWAG
jgi:hypothetical protein